MSNPVLESVFESKKNLIESFFGLFSGTGAFSLYANDVTWLLSKAKGNMNPEFFQLLSNISNVTSTGDQVTFNVGKKVSTALNIGGMPLNLTTAETITAKVNQTAMSLVDIKGLTASMGFMNIDLRGVKFKRDGNAFFVDLDTPMKTFSIKIPVI